MKSLRTGTVVQLHALLRIDLGAYMFRWERSPISQVLSEMSSPVRRLAVEVHVSDASDSSLNSLLIVL